MNAGTIEAVYLKLGTERFDFALGPDDDAAAMMVLQTLDLGFPEVREVTVARADAHGEWDSTRFFGSRGVTIHAVAVGASEAIIMAVIDRFRHFCVPGARPELHYVPGEDIPGRFIRLRVDSQSDPWVPHSFHAITASFKAPDAVSYSDEISVVDLIPLTAVGGRHYQDPSDEDPTPTSARGWPRVYPDVRGAVGATVLNAGNVPAPFVVTFTGPATNPALLNDTASVRFGLGTDESPFRVTGGTTVTVDVAARSVYRNNNPALVAYEAVDFARSRWWLLEPGGNELRYVPGEADDTSRAIVAWRNTYL